MDEDGRFDEVEMPSDLLGFVASDDAVCVGREEFGTLLIVLDKVKLLDDAVEVVGLDEGLVVVGDVEAAVELAAASLSSKVVWNAITGGAVVA